MLSKFFHDAIRDFLVLELDDGHIKDSIVLVLKHNLRNLDALQLAVAIGLKELKPVFFALIKNLPLLLKKKA